MKTGADKAEHNINSDLQEKKKFKELLYSTLMEDTNLLNTLKNDLITFKAENHVKEIKIEVSSRRSSINSSVQQHGLISISNKRTLERVQVTGLLHT